MTRLPDPLEAHPFAGTYAEMSAVAQYLKAVGELEGRIKGRSHQQEKVSDDEGNKFTKAEKAKRRKEEQERFKKEKDEKARKEKEQAAGGNGRN